MKKGRLKSAGPFALILAAGKGTRMKSEAPKVLHPLCGKPLVRHVLEKLAPLGVVKTFVVVGHDAQSVKEALRGHDVEFVHQKRQRGTGHAVMAAEARLRSLSGSLLVLYGDTPLIRSSTLEQLLEARRREDADLVFLTATYQDPQGYGRIIRTRAGQVVDIVEEKEATARQKTLREVNPGFYCFKVSSLLEGLEDLSCDNAAGEYYVTDLPRILRRRKKKVIALPAASSAETRGINTREELAEVESRMRLDIARSWMRKGVTILNPPTVYIDAGASIGPDTVIYPGVLIEGNTHIGSHCTIGSFSHLQEAVLEDGVLIDHCSVVRESRVGKGTHIGPFAHLRRNSVIASGARIGSFVEIKNSRVGDHTKAAHLAYLGDAEIGRDVNIGAGTITCNFDGLRKNKTVIEDGAFIGSDSQLIAPVTVRKGAYVAAGSTITEEVPPESLAIARSRQVTKKRWTRKHRKPQ